MNNSVAFIPARSGSKRIPGKNIKLLNGHPLIAYSIATALRSGIFEEVIVATDSEEIAQIAKKYGASVPTLRPLEISGSQSSDIEWVLFMLNHLLDKQEKQYDVFSILRPTSPLRTEDTIRRAWHSFIENTEADSLRAIEKCTQHPGKMWVLDDDGKRMKPLISNPDPNDVPWHSKQYAALPEIYVQNASLEIAWTKVPLSGNGIAGTEILPFITDEYEGFDLNYPEDWIVLEEMVKSGKVTLPQI